MIPSIVAEKNILLKKLKSLWFLKKPDDDRKALNKLATIKMMKGDTNVPDFRFLN